MHRARRRPVPRAGALGSRPARDRRTRRDRRRTRPARQRRRGRGGGRRRAGAPPHPRRATGGRRTAEDHHAPGGPGRSRRAAGLRRPRPTLAAASNEGSRVAEPPSRKAHACPDRSRRAVADTTSSSTGAGAPGSVRGAGWAPSDHEAWAGRSSVAVQPGGPVAAATAVAASTGTAATRDRPTHPTLQRRCQGVEVGLQRGVELLVCRRVVPDHVDHGCPRPSGVVQVGPAVRQTGPEVQERRGRPARHPPVAVRRAGDHALEQAEDGTHARDAVRRRRRRAAPALGSSRPRSALRRSTSPGRTGCRRAPCRRAPAAHALEVVALGDVGDRLGGHRLERGHHRQVHR